MQVTRIISGIRNLGDNFDTFILDQWGVLHFGQTAPAHVIDTLENLKAQAKNVVILSNSGKGAEYSADRLTKLGITRDLYDHIVTSGEMLRQGIQTKNTPIFENLGKRCFLISANNDRTTVEGLDIEVVENPRDADFILMINCDYKTRALESYDETLQGCAERSLPMICANPDTLVVDGDQVYYGPGRVAQRYESFGGKVHYIGKPHRPVFAYALSLVPNALPSKTIMIGDTMEHDIKGGVNMGFATCLTMSGAHAPAFKEKDIPSALYDMEKEFNILPTYIVDKFIW